MRQEDNLAKAVDGPLEVDGAFIDFGAVITRCTTIRRTGCVLAWCLCNIGRIQAIQGNSTFVRSFIVNSGVWHKGRRSRQALPICEGDFLALREVSQNVSLDEAASEKHVREWHIQAWELLSCVACNFLVGAGGPLAPGKWCAIEKALAVSVAATVERFEKNDFEHSDLAALEKELVSRRVSYTGEEFGVCNPLSLRQLVPALPPKEHGGVIDVLELVSPITRDLLLHPEKLEVEDVGQEFPKLQGRVHVRPGELDGIANELGDRGICMWFPLKKVKHVRGVPVLNGLFGVPKQTVLSDGSPVLRLIMNLIPGNAITKQIRGSVRNLPHITAWLSTYVEEGEQVQLWQSDMSNAFYLFKIPHTWAPYLAFNVRRVVSGEDGRGRGEEMVLACRVLPMGWASSVGVMQEISERLLWVGKLPKTSQLVRSRAVPLWMVGLLKESEEKGKAWWHVYLDNFAAGEIVKGGIGVEGDRLHILAEDAWEQAGVLSSEKKKKKGVPSVQELGAYIDGDTKTIGPASERIIKLIQGTLWLLGRRHMSKKLVQVIAGRWVHVFQFRRPAMAFLEDVWAFGSSLRFDQGLVGRVRTEFLHCIFAMPLLHTFLGADVTRVITASDASSTGGAVGISRELAPPGVDFVRCIHDSVGGKRINVLVISLFNGIGGAFRCYDVLGLSPLHMVSFDIHGPAQRVTSRRWPHAELQGDVRKLDRTMVERWMTEYPETEEIHLWAGFPCVDLSSVNVRGEGLEGRQSSLFYEIPRIKSTLETCKPQHVTLRFAVENVATMPKGECDKISNIMEVYPYHLDCAGAVPMRRPRLCWCSEAVGSNVNGVQITPKEHWSEVEAVAEYPPIESWIASNATWPGYEDGFILPTAMKAIKRSRPPPGPAGIDRCDSDTLARWQCDEFRFPPYHYQSRFIFWQSQRWRLANSSEKELLLGYGAHHTKLCYSASAIKQSKSKYEDERLSLLGDSFSIYSFVIVAAALRRSFLTRVNYHHLTRRMGLAPGFVLALHHEVPLSRKISYGFEGVRMAATVEMLNKILLSRTNHTGSDVRISTGEILNPKAAIRQSIEADWWKWEHVFQTKWKQRDHINLLELRSILLSIKFHISHLRHSQARIFHLSDSYVCMSVVSKGRSGSRQLNRVLRELNGYLLAFGLHLIIAHVESSENPTDGASRSMEVLQSPVKGRA